MPAGMTVIFPPISGPLAFATTAQLKQGLAVVDPAGLVKYNLPSDPTNAITIGWYEDLFANSGALYTFIQTQLGYTNAKMLAFYSSLSGYPLRP